MRKILIWLFSLVIVSSSCVETTENNNKIIKSEKNDYAISNQEFNFTDFNSIDVSGPFNVVIEQNETHSVKIDADNKTLSKLRVEQDGKTVKINVRSGKRLVSSAIDIYISSPEFVSLEASGSSSYKSKNEINTVKKLKIDLSGASKVDLKINATDLEIESSGASKISLSGTVKNLSVDGSGSSKLNCFDLIADHVKVDISGAGKAEVNANKSLSFDISGAVDIKYKGNPQIIKQEVSGAAKISKANN